jgi:hypothetical protein
MGLPGLLGSAVPPGPDEVWVQLAAVKAQAQQVQAQIGSAQALITLATQQNALNTAQIALAANQVVPAVGSASASGYVLTTAFQSLASFNFTTPTGYTQALISAVGAATGLSNFSGNESYAIRLVIAGTAGQEGRSLASTAAVWPSVPASQSLVVSGLTAGQTVQVTVQAKLSGGPGGSGGGFTAATVSGTAVFLR